MKISILSMQRVVNHGSVLQAYALRKMIRQVTGETAVFLDIDRTDCVQSHKSVSDNLEYEAPAAYPPGVLQKGKRFLITRLSGITKKKIRRFMKNELELSAETAKEAFDVTVIGSDEVFNHNGGQVCLQLHGQVRQAKRVITYAASCGNARAEDIPERGRVRQAMERLDAISVRDEATAQYVKALTGKTPRKHADPVLVGRLWERKYRPVPVKNYLLVYAYGQRIRTGEEIRAIQSYARRKGLKTVAVGGSQFWTDLYIPVSPMRLLDYFNSAACVVTDTFHGSVFSIIHSKPFAVLRRSSNQAKITGLLSDMALRERLTDAQGLDRVLELPVDHRRLRDTLEQMRGETLAYLKEQLGE